MRGLDALIIGLCLLAIGYLADRVDQHGGTSASAGVVPGVTGACFVVVGVISMLGGL